LAGGLETGNAPRSIMNPSYRMVGSDGKVYGPVPLDELQRWIHEGRVGPDTSIHRNDSAAWQPASSFPELGLAPTPTAPQPQTAIAPQTPGLPAASHPALAALALQVKSGASWFYWIAGLSLINTLAAIFQGGFGFVMGLGITQVLDAIGQQTGSGGRAFALTLNAAALALFVGFGWLANQRRTWAFAVGLVLYLLDGLIFVLGQQWLAVGFHGLAAFFIFKGLQACRLYGRMTART
jgi:hypothetical protein